MIFFYAVLHIANGHWAWVRPLFALLLVNGILLAVARPLFRRLGTSVAPWPTLRNTLRSFLAVARHAAAELPDETQLSLLKGHFTRSLPMPISARRAGGSNGRACTAACAPCSTSLVFFDLHVDEAVLARVVPNRDILLHGLSAMAELEALCSLASFSAELPVACYPRAGRRQDAAHRGRPASR